MSGSYLPSSTFLKLMLARLSRVSLSYCVSESTNSTSALLGSRGTRLGSWLPGLRSSGPSGTPSHSTSRALYSSGWVQITYTHKYRPVDLSGKCVESFFATFWQLEVNLSEPRVKRLWLLSTKPCVCVRVWTWHAKNPRVSHMRVCDVSWGRYFPLSVYNTMISDTIQNI